MVCAQARCRRQRQAAARINLADVAQEVELSVKAEHVHDKKIGALVAEGTVEQQAVARRRHLAWACMHRVEE